MKRRALLLFIAVLGVILSNSSAKAEIKGSELLEVKVQGVRMDPMTNSPIVLLKEIQGEGILPIWVGIPEARAIAMEMEKVPSPRPMTHDLIKNILETIKVKVNKVVINDLREETYYAVISLGKEGPEVMIDSRPSDAIAIALRAKAPIFVAKKILEERSKEEILRPLVKESESPEYGVKVEELSPPLIKRYSVKEKQGVLVTEIKKGGQADLDGIVTGDLIVEVNKKKIRNIEDFKVNFKELGKDLLLLVERERNLFYMILHTKKGK